MRIPVLFAVLTGCATGPREAAVKPLTAYVEKQKEKGPNLEPADALRTWLRSSNGAVLRVPLTVTQDAPAGLAGRLGAMPVELDDSALGVSLVDRVRQACGAAVTCTVWVEARWSDDVLRVLHFARAVVPGESADFVERELHTD